MLIFIDESGDSGLKVEHGSSRLFTISLVVFEEKDEALACDQRIDLLKRELGWKDVRSEFHFKRNSENGNSNPIPEGNAAINATV